MQNILKFLVFIKIVQINAFDCNLVDRNLFRNCTHEDEIYCDFIFEGTQTYKCSIGSQEEVWKNNETVIKTKVIGVHSEGRNDRDVKKILIESSSKFREIPGEKVCDEIRGSDPKDN